MAQLNPKIIESPVILLCGSGGSVPLGFKTTAQFIEVVANLCDKNQELREMFDDWSRKVPSDKRDIEGLLDHVHSLKSLGSDIRLAAERCEVVLRREIVEHYSDVDAEKAKHHYFWLLMYLKGYQEELHPIPIFTTNYDWAIDKALGSHKSSWKIVDGFRQGRFGVYWDHRVFERFKGTKMGWDFPYFKLHGSTSWYMQPDGLIFKTTHAELDPGRLKTMMIYPTLSKSKPLDSEPYATSYAYLRGCLSHGCRLCVVIGFSFRDTEICDIFAESLKVNKAMQILSIDPKPDQSRTIGNLNVEPDRIKFFNELE